MARVHFGIKTLPTTHPVVIAQIADRIHAPAAIKTPERLAAWRVKKKPALVAEAVAKTALLGGLGHVAFIGYSVGGNAIYCRSAVDSDEKTLLERFFSAVSDRLEGVLPGNVTLVGFNIINFDIRFLTQRAIILGVKLPEWWPIYPNPWDPRVVDLLIQWRGLGREYVNQDALCLIRALKEKTGRELILVAAAWASGKHERIKSYCCDDVECVIRLDEAFRAVMGG